MQKEIGMSIVNRDEKAHNRSHRCSSGHKRQWTEVDEPRERPSFKR